MAAAIAEPAPVGAATPPKGGKRKKLIVIVAVALAVVLGAGAGGVVYLKKKAAAAAAEADEEGEGGAVAAATPHPEKAPPAWLPLDPFIVNLADRDADRYAQIGITLELDHGGSAEQIRAYMPAVRNAILMILASKTSKDLMDRAGKEHLADEIMREAVRPMGIDIAAPQKVIEAPAAASDAAAGASAAAAKASDADPKAKRKARPALHKNPIQRVHFSSFIVQ